MKNFFPLLPDNSLVPIGICALVVALMFSLSFITNIPLTPAARRASVQNSSLPTIAFSINKDEAVTDIPDVVLFLPVKPPTGAVMMQFSSDGVNWSVPRSYSTFTSWTLSGAYGIKTVYVRIIDWNGNPIYQGSDSINYATGVTDTTDCSTTSLTADETKGIIESWMAEPVTASVTSSGTSVSKSEQKTPAVTAAQADKTLGNSISTLVQNAPTKAAAISYICQGTAHVEDSSGWIKDLQDESAAGAMCQKWGDILTERSHWKDFIRCVYPPSFNDTCDSRCDRVIYPNIAQCTAALQNPGASCGDPTTIGTATFNLDISCLKIPTLVKLKPTIKDAIGKQIDNGRSKWKCPKPCKASSTYNTVVNVTVSGALPPILHIHVAENYSFTCNATADGLYKASFDLYGTKTCVYPGQSTKPTGDNSYQ